MGSWFGSRKFKFAKKSKFDAARSYGHRNEHAKWWRIVPNLWFARKWSRCRFQLAINLGNQIISREWIDERVGVTARNCDERVARFENYKSHLELWRQPEWVTQRFTANIWWSRYEQSGEAGAKSDNEQLIQENLERNFGT